MTLVQDKLLELAQATVVKGDYPEPTPTLEPEIHRKREEILDFQKATGHARYYELHPRIEMSDAEYQAAMQVLKDELADLILQNEAIRTENRNAKVAVDVTYRSAIHNFVTDPANIAKAGRIVYLERLIRREYLTIAMNRLVTQALMTEDEKAMMLEDML